jgi:two-component system chemotaxis response regulator CheB
VCKPKLDVRERLPELGQEIIEKVKTAAAARIRRARGTFLGVDRPVIRRPTVMPASPIIAVGASTGGTEAIRELLSDMPPDFPGVLIVQHMPSKFTRAFADRLDKLCQVRVKEAADGDPVLLGHVLIAPGDYHMRLVREQGGHRVRVTQDPPVNRHRPSVDVLFHSCAECGGANTVGVLLTGMGEDGARGLLAMRQAGSATFAQDEATSVVYGMPKAAVELGAAARVLPLHRMLDGVRGALSERTPERAY